MPDCQSCAMTDPWGGCVLPIWIRCQYDPFPPAEGWDAWWTWQYRGCRVEETLDGAYVRVTPERVPYREATIPVKDPYSLRPARSWVRDEEGT